MGKDDGGYDMLLTAVGEITFGQVWEWLGKYILWIIGFVSSFIEITPIKINPISWLLSLLFKPMKKEIDSMKKEINTRMDEMKSELKEEINQLRLDQQRQQETTAELIKSNEIDKINQIRWEIINFSRSIDNKQLHLRDEYRHIKDINRQYHELIEKHKMTNGYIDEEMEKIDEHYEKNKDSNQVYF